jgi:DNA-directed RNA polymerase specialized sigma subunit
VASLPHRERIVVAARYGIGRPTVSELEVATELSVSRDAVAALRRRAIARLRTALTDLSADAEVPRETAAPCVV